VNPDVARARDLVLSHGWNSTSFQIVNPGIKRWFSAEGDAVVGFVQAKRRWIVVGAPVCAKARLAAVSYAFEAEARERGFTACYFGAESRLETTVVADGSHSEFLIGAQPVWHPQEWARIVAADRTLRSQINRARNKGVSVEEWTVEQAANNTRLAELLAAWLSSKGLPPLHFMVETDTLDRLEHRRIFVAKAGDKITGFVILSPVPNRNGWLFEQFPHRPGSANGTVEFMIDAAMRKLAEDGAEYATLGISPLSTRADLPPVAPPLWVRVILLWLRRHGRRFYNFDGLDAFKAKLRPMRWEPVYVLVNEPKVRVGTLAAILDAFSGNAPVSLVTSALFKAAATELARMRAVLKAPRSGRAVSPK